MGDLYYLVDEGRIWNRRLSILEATLLNKHVNIQFSLKGVVCSNTVVCYFLNLYRLFFVISSILNTHPSKRYG